jgi:2-keto-4-pentenoate hydratase/2-oxohepta-3-ene-1,7-dioic acid hydratase in catechol pathway
MRYVTFLQNGIARPGVFDGTHVRAFEGVETLTDFIALPPDDRTAVPLRGPLALQEVTLLPPIVPRKNVVCVGRNYLGHAEEVARARGVELKLPSVPTFFTKAPTSITRTEAVLRLSSRVSSQYDWEAELAVVMGERCRDVPRERALEMVFGYTCLNDVTARDLQQAHGQWFKGKSLDDACPMGPWIVSADEISDPQTLRVTMRVNSVIKQNASTSAMIFPVAEIIASLSRGMSLEPGDVIATGTPEGVGFARTPPEFLADGDVMEVEIERIGILRNTFALTEASLGCSTS